MMMRGEGCHLEALHFGWAPQFAGFLEAGVNFTHTFTGSIPMRTVDVEKEWEKERLAGSIQWAIFGGSEFIGTTGLYSHRDIYRSWEFRILIGKPGELGKGIGTQVTRMVVDWGFKRLNAHRIELGVNCLNLGAVKCYRNVGFKDEGVLRDAIFIDGHYTDVIRMSVLEDEWRTAQSS